MRILTISIFCALLNGCIGAGLVTFSSESIHKNSMNGSTKSDVLKLNGEPSSIKKISEIEEVYIYDKGLGWTGALPYIVVTIIPVPLPLLIPTRRNYDEYHLLSEKLLSKTTHTTKTELSECILGFGIESEATMKFGWISKCKTERQHN
jgi:hypothetical protein